MIRSIVSKPQGIEDVFQEIGYRSFIAASNSESGHKQSIFLVCENSGLVAFFVHNPIGIVAAISFDEIRSVELSEL